MKLDISAIRLAPVNRAYRGAFRSGHGGSHGAARQALHRIAFYALETMRLPGRALEVDLRVRGLPVTLRLNPYNRQFSPLYFAAYEAGYETAVARAIAAHLPDDGVFVDVGCNWGYFPLLLASDPRFQGRVHAFEPVPSTYADLVSVVEQAGIGQWVEPHHAAVGDRCGTVSMKLARHSGLASVDEQGKGGVEVPLVSLDSFEWDRLDVLKVDVEGFESAVFEGARSSLERHRPVVVFEDGVADPERSAETLSFLESLGYRLHQPVASDESSPYRPFEAARRRDLPPYLNVVAIPRERLPA